uniref:Reverse transcriptase domain-containing protein n=1 Tax=Tanacetum cinerariifolium TaxID=118510 RepID=A0A6L2KEE7_TANCI|nr:hypothetical protein [Tanacetum cinerariifolium]
MEKEELIVHLAVVREAVFRGRLYLIRKQMPVYFVSHALKGPEVNYTPVEKLERYVESYLVEEMVVMVKDCNFVSKVQE